MSTCVAPDHAFSRVPVKLARTALAVLISASLATACGGGGRTGSQGNGATASPVQFNKDIQISYCGPSSGGFFAVAQGTFGNPTSTLGNFRIEVTFRDAQHDPVEQASHNYFVAANSTTRFSITARPDTRIAGCTITATE
ncbi:MAG TPA: hypothetical protein VFZ97_06740 [Acidimicrobiales bacterium]